ncbi:hypothetical protein Tco_0228999, partial [Tanacetum coccineum]
PEVSGGNHRDQAKEIKHLKAQIKKLKKQEKPVITHHKAWMKSVSLKQRLAGKKSLKSNWMQKESVSKQGRKSPKAEPSVHKDPLFDKGTDDRTEAKSATPITSRCGEDKKWSECRERGTDKEKEGTDKEKEGTDKEKEGTEKEKDSTVSLDEGTDDRTEERSATSTTPSTTPTMFG